jgi:uroporphyrinogen decarboxylase
MTSRWQLPVVLTPKQIVLCALRGEETPRPAVGPLAVHYCARVAGRSLREYTTDAEVLAECVIRYYDRFRPDAVWVSADTWVVAEAMGAAARFPDEEQPKCGTGEPLVRCAADVERIAPPDPHSQGRCPIMIEALRRIRSALGDETFIVACFDQYPFSLACQLLGAEQAMLAVSDGQPLVETVMQRAVEYAAAYGQALAEAGADMLSGGDSPAGLLGPRLYGEAALPMERRLIARLRSTVQVPISLHICGDATSILPAMATSGADVLELDHKVSVAAAAERLGRDVAIWGNLDPVGVLAQGTVEQARRATCDLLAAVRRHGVRRFVLSSGCTIAVETPPENLQAMFDAAHGYTHHQQTTGLPCPTGSTEF